MSVEALSTWSMRSSSRARTCSSRGGMGSGAVSAGEDGRDTDAAAAEHAATAADRRLFSVCKLLCRPWRNQDLRLIRCYLVEALKRIAIHNSITIYGNNP